MPGFDKTGPNGEGAMTGRKDGLCTGNNSSGMGRGRGGGRGRGLSRRSGGGRMRGDFNRENVKEGEDALQQEVSEMRKQIAYLQEELSRAKKD